jgi:carbon-monoxide dehydrogenase medium subunit
VHGIDGNRVEALRAFFTGPGQTVLKPGDIVTSVEFPIPPKGAQGKYLKLGRNAIGDLAIVGVTALGYPDGAAASGFRFFLALASVAPTPLMPDMSLLSEKPITEQAINAAAEFAMNSVTPIDDVRGSARYRKLMVRDSADDPAAVRMENGETARTDTVAIDLRAGGGFIGRFEP